MAAKVDLDGIDTSNLDFYSYDRGNNTYTRIQEPNYRIDANSYLHFTTRLAEGKKPSLKSIRATHNRVPASSAEALFFCFPMAAIHATDTAKLLPVPRVYMYNTN